jgi:hypothetical protein
LIEALGENNLVFKEALIRKMELPTELAGPDASPLARLLAGRVVACCLHLHDAEMRLAEDEPKLTLAQGEYHQRRLDRAHQRYLSAHRRAAAVLFPAGGLPPEGEQPDNGGGVSGISFAGSSIG